MSLTLTLGAESLPARGGDGSLRCRWHGVSRGAASMCWTWSQHEAAPSLHSVNCARASAAALAQGLGVRRPHFVANGADLPRIKNREKGARFRDPVPIPIKQDQANRSIVLPRLEWLC